jgi:hypothetical protein
MENIGPEYSLDAAATEFVTPIFEEASDVVVFGHEKFHPYSPVEPWRRDEDFPEAYTIHRWGGHWKSRDYYRQRVEHLQIRLHRARSRLERTRDRNRKLRRRLEASERRVAELERRLTALERSRWWRLRGRLRPLLRAARAVTRTGSREQPAKGRPERG